MVKRIFRRLWYEWLLRTDPIRYARSLGVQIGENCRLVGLQYGAFGSEPYLVRLGNHVEITGVKFITHDDGVWIFLDRYPDLDIVAPIRVGNNVYIGMNTIILPGVNIGDNCIIGAGAIVTKDVPSGTVAVGVPARVVKTVDDYLRDAQDEVLHIRLLSPIQKKDFLTRRFVDKT